MNTKRWLIFIGLAIFLIGIGYAVVAWMNRSSGPAFTLQIPSTRPPTMNSLQIATTPTPFFEDGKMTATLPPEVTRETEPSQAGRTCGNVGTVHLLVVGLTLPANGDILGADAIRLITINYSQPSVTILTIPAMLWVKTPALTDLGVNQIQLAAVYSTAYSATVSEPVEIRAHKATQVLAQTIVDNFNYVPDHYITVNDAEFSKLIDTLGGIDIDLPNAVDGSSEGYGLYPAGHQQLDGTRALNFARLFHPDGIRSQDVWGNLERQAIVVKAILATSIKPRNWAKLPELISKAQQTVITDLSPEQTLRLTCVTQEVGENTQIRMIGQDMVSRDQFGHLIPDYEAIHRLITEIEASN